jgi:methylglutaconyl-CoA hydratase
MPDSEKLVRLEQRGQVAWLVIDSPANRNALGGPVLDGLVSGLKEALGSPEVRVIVVTGTGHVFSSGADLRDTTDLAVIEQAYRDLFRGIADAGKPIVARINGHCFGGAIGLAAICDLSVAVDEALFAFNEVRLGRTATLASVVSLPRLRPSDGADLLLRGNRIDGARAADLGLVNKAVPRDRLDAEVDEILADLLAAGPVALANTKRLIRSSRMTRRGTSPSELHEKQPDPPRLSKGRQPFARNGRRSGQSREPDWIPHCVSLTGQTNFPSCSERSN